MKYKIGDRLVSLNPYNKHEWKVTKLGIPWYEVQVTKCLCEAICNDRRKTFSTFYIEHFFTFKASARIIKIV